jgi:hypothetical protein
MLGDGRAAHANEFPSGGVKQIGRCGQHFNNSNARHRKMGNL